MKPKRKSGLRGWLPEEKPVPVPESIRQEDGREVKVYPKRYADGYQAQQNVRPKGTVR